MTRRPGLLLSCALLLSATGAPAVAADGLCPSAAAASWRVGLAEDPRNLERSLRRALDRTPEDGRLRAAWLRLHGDTGRLAQAPDVIKRGAWRERLETEAALWRVFVHTGAEVPEYDALAERIETLDTPLTLELLADVAEARGDVVLASRARARLLAVAPCEFENVRELLSSTFRSHEGARAELLPAFHAGTGLAADLLAAFYEARDGSDAARVALAQRWLETHPDDEMARVVAAEAFVNLARHDEAVAVLEGVVGWTDTYPGAGATLARAEALLRNGDPTAARRETAALTAVRPQGGFDGATVEASTWSSLLLSTGELGKARAFLDGLEPALAGTALLQLRRAELERRSGRHEEAVEAARRALEGLSDVDDAIGELLKSLRGTKAADETEVRALLAPRTIEGVTTGPDPDHFMQATEALIASDAVAPATGIGRAAVEAYPRSSWMRRQLARVLAADEDFASALAELEVTFDEGVNSNDWAASRWREWSLELDAPETVATGLEALTDRFPAWEQLWEERDALLEAEGADDRARLRLWRSAMQANPRRYWPLQHQVSLHATTDRTLEELDRFLGQTLTPGERIDALGQRVWSLTFRAREAAQAGKDGREALLEEAWRANEAFRAEGGSLAEYHRYAFKLLDDRGERSAAARYAAEWYRLRPDNRDAMWQLATSPGRNFWAPQRYIERDPYDADRYDPVMKLHTLWGGSAVVALALHARLERFDPEAARRGMFYRRDALSDLGLKREFYVDNYARSSSVNGSSERYVNWFEAARQAALGESGTLAELDLDHHRVVMIRPDGLEVEYRADPVAGLRSYVRLGAGWMEARYDERSRLTGLSDSSGNEVTLAYDEDGSITSVAASDGRRVRMRYVQVGAFERKPSQVEVDDVGVLNVTYGDDGEVASIEALGVDGTAGDPLIAMRVNQALNELLGLARRWQTTQSFADAPELPYEDTALEAMEADAVTPDDWSWPAREDEVASAVALAEYLVEHVGDHRDHGARAEAMLRAAILGRDGDEAPPAIADATLLRAVENWVALQRILRPAGLPGSLWVDWIAIEERLNGLAPRERRVAARLTALRSELTNRPLELLASSTWLPASYIENPGYWRNWPLARLFPTALAEEIETSAVLVRAGGEVVVGTSHGIAILTAGHWQFWGVASDGRRLLREPDAGELRRASDVRALAEDERGALWIGTASGLLILDDGYDGALKRVARPADGLPTPVVTHLEAVPGGMLVGTAEGVIEFDLAGGPAPGGARLDGRVRALLAVPTDVEMSEPDDLHYGDSSMDGARMLATAPLVPEGIAAVRLRRGATAEPVDLAEAGDAASAAAFSPDGRRLAVADGAGRVRIMDADGRGEATVLDVPPGQVLRSAFSADGARLAVSVEDADVVLMPLGRRGERRVLPDTAGTLGIGFSPDGSRVAIGTRDGQVLVYDADSGAYLTGHTEHTDWVRDVAFVDDAQLVSVADDRRVLVWRPDRGDRPVELTGHGDWIRAVAVDHDRGLLASGDDSGVVRIWSTDAGALVGGVELGFQIEDLRFGAEAELLAVGAEETRIVGLDPMPKLALAAPIAVAGTPLAARFLDDGRIALQRALDDGRAELVLAAADGPFPAPGAGVPGTVALSGFSPDGERAASVDASGTVMLRALTSAAAATRVGSVEGEATALAFAPTGDTLAVASEPGRVTLLDAAGEGAPRVLDAGVAAIALAFSPDGGQLALGTRENRVLVLDVDSGALIASLDGHWDWVRDLRFLSGERLLSASDDGTVVLWDLAAGEEAARLEGHGDWVFALAVDGTRGRLASGDDSGEVRFWSLEDLAPLGRVRSPWPVRGLSFAPDGRLLVVGNGGLAVATLPDAAPARTALRPSGALLRFLAAGFAADGSVRMIEALRTDGYLPQTLVVQDRAGEHLLETGFVVDESTGFAIAPDGRSLYAVDSVGTLRLWGDAGTGFREIDHLLPAVGDAAYLETGELLVCFEDAVPCRVLPSGADVSASIALAETEEIPDPGMLVPSPGGARLLLTRGEILAWSLRSPRGVELAPTRLRADPGEAFVAFSAGGENVLFSDAAGELREFVLATGEVADSRGVRVFVATDRGVRRLDGTRVDRMLDEPVDALVADAARGRIQALSGEVLYEFAPDAAADSGRPVPGQGGIRRARALLGLATLPLDDGDPAPVVLSDLGLSIYRDLHFEYKRLEDDGRIAAVRAAHSAGGRTAFVTDRSVRVLEKAAVQVDTAGRVHDLLVDDALEVTFVATGYGIDLLRHEALQAGRSRFSGVRATRLVHDRDGALLANDGSRIVRFEAGATQPEVLFDATPGTSESSGRVTGLLAASDGSVWVTHGPSAFRWHEDEGLTEFSYLLDPETAPFRTDMLFNVLETYDGRIWVVASNESHRRHNGVRLVGGLYEWTGDGFRRIEDEQDNAPPGHFMSSYTVMDGDRAIAGTTEGFSLHTNESFSRMRDRSDPSYDQLTALHPNVFLGTEGARVDDDTWLFGSAAGLVGYHDGLWFVPEQLNWLLPDHDLARYGARAVHAVAVDDDGRIYAGTDRGLLAYDTGGAGAVELFAAARMPELAFQVAEADKLRSQVDMLVDRFDPDSTEGRYVRRYRELEARIAALAARLGTGFRLDEPAHTIAPSADSGAARGASDDGDRAEDGADAASELRERLDEYQRNRTALLARLERDAYGLHQMLELKPLELEALRRELPSDTTIVQFLPAAENLLIYVVSRERAFIREVAVPREELFSVAREVSARFRAGVEFEESEDAPQDLLTSQLFWLYQHLLAPVERDVADAEHVLLVPVGPLAYVPFAALVRETDPAPRYAAELFQLGVLPSMYILDLVLRDVPSLSSDMLAIGDPDGSLPAARIEASEVVNRYGAGARALIGGEATRSALEDIGRGARQLHLATHGVLDPERPEESYLLLADHRLSVVDIMTLPLEETELAFLSACETGLGSNRGLEFASISRAFAHAGVPSVIASLWEVPDAPTRSLVNHFYEAYQGKEDAVAALAAAQRRMIKSKQTAAPWNWAAFQVYGRP